MATLRPGVAQFAREFFDDGRLARAADGQVADGDDLHAERGVAQDADVVEPAAQGGQSVRQIAADLGITSQSLKLWKKQLAVLPATGPGQRSLPQLEEENRRLKRELHGALRRCDILKKTLGILSNPNDNALNA